jgi:hypothetical protein
MISIYIRQNKSDNICVNNNEILPLNNLLFAPIERRIKPLGCNDGVERLNIFCIRLSAENDPESEEDE